MAFNAKGLISLVKKRIQPNDKTGSMTGSPKPNFPTGMPTKIVAPKPKFNDDRTGSMTGAPAPKFDTGMPKNIKQTKRK